MKSQKIILKRNLKNSKKIINSGQVVARTRKFLKRNNKTKKQRGGLPPSEIKYFTRTNHYVGVENPMPNDLPSFLYISHRPIDCLVYLQYLISTKKIAISKKEKKFEIQTTRVSKKGKTLSETQIETKNEYYLSYHNTPSLIVEESPTKKYTQFTSSEFITVCQKSLEDNFSQKILEKYERIVKDILKQEKLVKDIIEQDKLSENLSIINSDDSTVLFNRLPLFQNQNNTQLSIEKKLELLRNFYLENLRKNLFILQVIHKKQDGIEHEVSLVQNIQYVNDLIAKLQKIDSQSVKHTQPINRQANNRQANNTQTNNTQANNRQANNRQINNRQVNNRQPINRQENNTQQSTDECDYSNEYNEYEFIEELETEFGTVKIVGCLDYKKMAPYLKNEELLKYFKEFICGETFEQDFIDFYDSLLKVAKNDSSLESSSVEDIFIKKKYWSPLCEFQEFVPNLLKYLKENGKLKEEISYEEALHRFKLFFLEKIKIMSQDFLKKLDVKSISYIWHCFLKKIRRTSVGIQEIYYEPMVFTIQELEKKHLGVLKKIEELIEKIYAKFNILHRNLVSFASEGQLFSIRTRNQNDAFTYSSYSEKMVTLSYLIYSLGTEMVDNFWQKLEVEYPVKNFLVKGLEKLYEKKKINTTQSGTLKLKRKISKKNQSTIKNESIINNFPNSSTTPKSPQKDFGIEEPSNILYNATILYIKTHPSKEVEIFFKASNGKFYYLKLIPILKRMDLFKVMKKFESSTTNVFYKCGSDNMRTLDYELPLYYFEEPLEITINIQTKKKIDSVNIFQNDIFIFPTLTQNIKNYDKFNKFLKSLLTQGLKPEEEKFELYFPFLIYNSYQAFVQHGAYLDDNNNINIEKSGKDIMDFNIQNPNCKITICNSTENSLIYIFKKIRIEIDDVVYIILFKKIKFKDIIKDGYDEFKFVIWVFQTEKDENGVDKPIQFHNNKLRNILYLNGSHLKKLLDRILEEPNLFNCFNPSMIDLSNYRNFFVNLTSGILVDSFHIQFVPFVNLINYESHAYGKNISYFTQEREKNCQNLVNLLNVDSNFFRKMINNTDFKLVTIPMFYSI